MAARGGKATASKLTPEERRARAKKGAEARWAKARKKAERKAAREAKKATEPAVVPARTPIKGETGMPGHSEHCQCMGCRAYRAGWRPE
jgi:hypothetical protein